MPIPNCHKRTPPMPLRPHDAAGDGSNSVEERWRHGVNDDGNKVVTWWRDVGKTVATLWPLCVRMVVIAWCFTTMQPHFRHHPLPIRERSA